MQYQDGREIHIGDHVLFGGHPATVVVVISRGEYSKGFAAGDWAEHSHGFVMQTVDGQLYLQDYADEDVKLIARFEAAGCP